MRSQATLLFTQTTWEEYRYITKGWAIEQSNGLDPKRGYSWSDMSETKLTTADGGSITVGIRGLMRSGMTEPCALMLAYKLDTPSRKAAMVHCIPSTDAPKELWDETWKSLGENEVAWKAMTYALMKFGSQESTK